MGIANIRIGRYARVGDSNTIAATTTIGDLADVGASNTITGSSSGIWHIIKDSVTITNIGGSVTAQNRVAGDGCCIGTSLILSSNLAARNYVNNGSAAAPIPTGKKAILNGAGKCIFVKEEMHMHTHLIDKHINFIFILFLPVQ